MSLSILKRSSGLAPFLSPQATAVATTVLSVSGLCKRYGSTTAVRDFSLDVEHGEIVGLLGANGAGKTTALECILGLRDADGGHIVICGRDFHAHRNECKILMGASLQDTVLQDKLTPHEALLMFAAFYACEINVTAVLHRFGLQEKANAYYSTLSAGQQQRLALALAILHRPPLLVLDEPTAGLDPLARHELHALLRELRSEGHSVLLATHDLEEAAALCDRVAVLSRGHLIACDTPQQLIGNSKGWIHIELTAATDLNLDKLPTLPHVRNMTVSGATLRLDTTDAVATVDALMAYMKQGKRELLELQVRKASLEQAFLELTASAFIAETPP